VVDNYIYILGILGEKVELLDDAMTLEPRKALLEEINGYKREVNFLRKSMLPAKEMIMSLAKLDAEYIAVKNKLHFRELQYNINEAVELSDSYREILFDQNLKQDPLRLLLGISRNQVIIATWNGSFINNRLTYAAIGHPEYVYYDKPDSLIVELNDVHLNT